jgi:hypothetical protein
LLRLATRSRATDGLRANVGSIREPNHKGKLVIDITGELAGPPKIPGGGHYALEDLHGLVVLPLGLPPLIMTYLNPKWQLMTQFHLKVNEMRRWTREEENMATMTICDLVFFDLESYQCYVVIL